MFKCPILNPVISNDSDHTLFSSFQDFITVDDHTVSKGK